MVGASGGIGGGFVAALRASGSFAAVVGLSRTSEPALDLALEASVEAAARHLADRHPAPRLVVVATGFLHGDGFAPEKSWRELDPAHLARAFAVNAIGPALVLKHFLPLLPRDGKSVFATLSARVGSIGDNGLGGWYSYRASKAALNQLLRTAAVELRRRWPEAVCVALHPGTVATRLSEPFAKAGLDVRTPATAAARLLAVIDRLGPTDNGRFFDHRGTEVPW